MIIRAVVGLRTAMAKKLSVLLSFYETKRAGLLTRPLAALTICRQLHPLVAPQEMHFRQVPLRTIVNCPHSPQASPS